MIRLNWQSFWYASAVLSLAFVPTTLAQKECHLENPKKCAQWVAKGTTVPFSGQLLTLDLAIDLGLKAERFEIQLNLELDRLRKKHEIDLDLAKFKHKSDKEAWEKKEKYLLEELKKKNNRPFFEHPIVVALLTAGVMLGIYFAVEN